MYGPSLQRPLLMAGADRMLQAATTIKHTRAPTKVSTVRRYTLGAVQHTCVRDLSPCMRCQMNANSPMEIGI